MTPSDRDEEFVRELTGAQPMLYAFIRSLLPRRDGVADVLQETNLVLWRKSAEFELGTSFVAWACSIAKYQVMAHLTSRGRDRHRFDDALLATLAQRLDGRVQALADRHEALGSCLEKLIPRDRDLILERYTQGASVKVIARRVQKSEDAISSALYRIRGLLVECVRRQTLGMEGA